MALAEGCGCVIIVASTHLGAHGFQFVRGTPNAGAFIEAQAEADPAQTLAAKVQSFISGTAVGLVGSQAHRKVGEWCSITSLQYHLGGSNPTSIFLLFLYF